MIAGIALFSVLGLGGGAAEGQLDDATYEELKAIVPPERGELDWLEIGWRPALWEGLRESCLTGKPVLLWAMNGHPSAVPETMGSARRSVWSELEVQELLRQFVPVADEVNRLQRGEGPEAKLFQEIAEQGHYAGRTQPSNTRQGIYAAAPSGVLLASVNTRNGPRVAKGTRWGASQYNGRADDTGPAEMGVVFTLAPDGAPRVAPASIWKYGWR